MMYLRHEAGHAFNYAYELYKTPEWRDLFGPFRRPYRDDYRPVPFSRRFVRHIAGWYAQKHPDEDFAETFAVWLTPRSQWRRKRYKGWGAMAKLRYVDRMARKFRDARARAAAGRHGHHRRGDGDDRRGLLQEGARGAVVRRARARHRSRRHLQGLQRQRKRARGPRPTSSARTARRSSTRSPTGRASSGRSSRSSSSRSRRASRP